MGFWRALKALRNDDLPTREELQALRAQIDATAAQVADCLEVVESEAHREAKWQDQQLQLRKLLGRLDAHAGHENSAGPGGQDPKVLAAILRTKFPNAGG